jgi:type IV pilus assembly protein PilO
MQKAQKITGFTSKPWHVQFIVFAVVGALVYGLVWYFITSPVRTETQGINDQVEQLKRENQQALIASQRINEFRAAYAQAQAEYEELKALLPEQRELTVVLQGLQDRARDNLSVRRFTPKDDVQQDFYSGKPIEVEVSGTYNKLGEFFAQMAAYQRIVSITDFNIRQAPEQNSARTIDAQFLLTAYYASPDKLQNNAPAKPGATPAAPAAPAQPATK